MMAKVQRSRLNVQRAFTLIEMLTVIAIIGIIAGLIVYLLPGINQKKIRGRALAEMGSVITAIESYKEKKGFFPPSNPNPAFTNYPPLYYELTSTPLPPAAAAFDLTNSVLNVGSEDSRNIFQTLRDSQIIEVQAPNKPPGTTVRFLGVKAKGADGNDYATWCYDSSSARRHNHESFDLWVDIKIGNDVITIGNWKE